MNAKVFYYRNQAARLNLKNSGTTLVELIVSIFVFSVVMLGGMSFFTLGNDSFQRAKQVSFATQLGYGAIEAETTLPWYNLWDASGGGTTQNTVTYEGHQFTSTVTITGNLSGPEPMIQLHCKVIWDNQLPSQVVDFDTIISSPIVVL